MEAMGAGLPVVATGNGGIPELIGGVGPLIPERDAEALADELRRVHCDSEARVRAGRAGRQRVIQDFNVETVVSQLVKCFEGSIGQWGTPGRHTEPTQ
jgi:glycosyltransferase involved in cell wall biosynthesis